MRFKDLHEKATSIAQQKLMALALQHKRGELDADKVTPAVEKLAKSMSEKELDDFASTKHKGLPQKKEDVKEAHDPKHVKMAIGVASDKRYKQGNYSGAVRAIEKIKKGLSKHPQVAAVLKRQNEVKEYLEMGTDEIRRTYAKETPGQTNEVGFQGTAATAARVGALAAVGGAAYAAKKARDRFDPVKVAAARRKKAERRAEVDKAKQELDQRKQYRQKLRDMQRKQRARQAAR